MLRIFSAALALAWAGISAGSPFSLVITLLNDFGIGINEVGGCDYTEASVAPYTEYLMVVDDGSNYVHALDPDDGTALGYLPVTSSVPNPYGIAVDWSEAYYYLYLNDWNAVPYVYRFYSGPGGGWIQAFINPASSGGRGMDMDADDYLWEIAGNRWLYRFDASGGNLDSWFLSELPTMEASGCAVFPIDYSTLGILVTCFYSSSFYLYQYDGDDLSFVDSVSTPYSHNGSFDLTFSPGRLTFFWVWRQGAATRCTEFELEIETPIERNSWGAIKASTSG